MRQVVKRTALQTLGLVTRCRPGSGKFVSAVSRNADAFFSIYLEKGGRLGLKCLLLSYFRVGDHATGTQRTDDTELDERIVVNGSIQMVGLLAKTVQQRIGGSAVCRSMHHAGFPSCLRFSFTSDKLDKSRKTSSPACACRCRGLKRTAAISYPDQKRAEPAVVPAKSEHECHE
jgi:hypothetical protein